MERTDSSPTRATSTTVVVAFELTDTAESFHVAAREGVATIFPGRSDDAQATVQLPQRVWIALVLGVTSLGEALLAEGVEAAGDLAHFVRFHRRFATAAAAPSRQRRAGRKT